MYQFWTFYFVLSAQVDTLLAFVMAYVRTWTCAHTSPSVYPWTYSRVK